MLRKGDTTVAVVVLDVLGFPSALAFFGVTALTAADVWAVGGMDMGDSNSHAPLAERRNGRFLARTSGQSERTQVAARWSCIGTARGGGLLCAWSDAAR